MTSQPILLLLGALLSSLLGGIFISSLQERLKNRTMRACVFVFIVVFLAAVGATLIRQNSSPWHMMVVPFAVLLGSLVYRWFELASATSGSGSTQKADNPLEDVLPPPEAGSTQKAGNAAEGVPAPSESGWIQKSFYPLVLRHAPALGAALALALILPLTPPPLQSADEGPTCQRGHQPPPVIDSPTLKHAKPDTAAVNLKISALIQAESVKSPGGRVKALGDLAAMVARTLRPALPAAFNGRHSRDGPGKGLPQVLLGRIGRKGRRRVGKGSRRCIQIRRLAVECESPRRTARPARLRSGTE